MTDLWKILLKYLMLKIYSTLVRLTIWHHLFLQFWLVNTWFLLTDVTKSAVTCLESVRQLNIRKGKKLGFQLLHRQPHRQSFLSILDTGQVTQKLLAFLFWKIYPGWRDVGWTSPLIDKMTDFWRFVLKFSQCWKCINKGSWVSWTLVTWVRNYKPSYFASFTNVGVMSNERLELMTKKRISGKLF